MLSWPKPSKNVEQLKEAANSAAAAVTKTERQIEIQKELLATTTAGVTAAEAAVREARAFVDAEVAKVSELKIEVGLSEKQLARQRQLVSEDAASEQQVEEAQRRLEAHRGQLTIAEATERQARERLSRVTAEFDQARLTERGARIRLTQLSEADLPMAQANNRQAHLAAEIGHWRSATPALPIFRLSFIRAEYDLRESVVRAPSDGYVAGLVLRRGQRVANLPLRGWMTYVVTDRTRVAVGIKQNALRYVDVGQPAEVVLKLFPGRTISATVEQVANLTSEAQVQASGVLPDAPSVEQEQHPYAVILRLDDESITAQELRGGAAGSAAIYTDSAKATHLIRRVMIRMETWLNFVWP